MRFGKQARLCLAINDFEAHIMLKFSRCDEPTGMGEVLNLFGDFYWFINVVKSDNIALVSLTNAYNSSGLIKFKEKKLVTQIKPGVMLCLCLIFHQKSDSAY